MPESRQCLPCGYSFPLSAGICPHCGRPSYYPNVDAANDAVERQALSDRYDLARSEAVRRGADAVLKDFERAIVNTKAVITRSASELHRLATNDHELYPTYYKLIEAGVKLPEGGKWDALRMVADAAFFTGYVEDIRFAALSLEAVGLTNYGSCSLVLRSEMIAHRASAVEENSVLFVDHHNILMKDAHQLPSGYRSTWDERAKLCVAKLSRKIDVATRPDQYSAILVQRGATSEDDEFVEIHIWGPMTIRTIEQVTFNPPANRAERAIIKAIKERLRRLGVSSE